MYAIEVKGIETISSELEITEYGLSSHGKSLILFLAFKFNRYSI